MDKLIRFTELGGLRACDKVVYINPRYVVEVEEGYTSNQTEITTINRCIAVKGDLEIIINKLNGSCKLPKE